MYEVFLDEVFLCWRIGRLLEFGLTCFCCLLHSGWYSLQYDGVVKRLSVSGGGYFRAGRQGIRGLDNEIS